MLVSLRSSCPSLVVLGFRKPRPLQTGGVFHAVSQSAGMNLNGNFSHLINILNIIPGRTCGSTGGAMCCYGYTGRCRFYRCVMLQGRCGGWATQ